MTATELIASALKWSISLCGLSIHTADALNRPIQEVRATEEYKAHSSVDYTYDAVGNLTQTVDAKGQVFSQSYDDLNRLEEQSFPPGDDIERIVMGYDANSNVVSITETKPSGVELTEQSYDLLDRLTQRIQRGHVVDYGYDNNGNRISLTSPGGSTSYTFDSRNRL